MKYCNTCKTTKLLEDFPTDNGREDGKGSNCKKCRNEWQRKKRGTESTCKVNGAITALISGTFPLDGECAIYVLWKQGEVFYVGSTTNPLRRMYGHIRLFEDYNINMCVLKNVPVDDRTYWECKYIVEYTEAGCMLKNNRTPAPNERARRGDHCQRQSTLVS